MRPSVEAASGGVLSAGVRIPLPNAVASPLPRSASRLRADLQRFGMTPRKLAARLFERRAPRVLVVSLPKAGTHLVERTLCLYPTLYRKVIPTVNAENLSRWGSLERLLGRLRPGQVVVSHLEHDAERSAAVRATDTRCLFVVRDPRDIAVSLSHYAAAKPDHPRHAHFAAVDSLEERVRLVIEGVDSLPPIAQRLERYSGWLDEPDCFVVRFEALVGPQGGGSGQQRERLLRDLFDFLGLPLDDGSLATLERRIFSRASPTFRRGAIGQWRQTLSPRIQEELNRSIGPLLDRYGYG